MGSDNIVVNFIFCFFWGAEKVLKGCDDCTTL